MNKQEVIERLNNKLDEVFAFQRSFKPLTGAHMECESKANAYMTAINYVEQLDEPQKVKVKQFVADWYEEHKGDLEFSIWKLTIESNDNYTSDRSKMRNWIQHAPNKPYETLLSMKNGYEVEEKPKWVVKKREDSYFKSFTGIDFRSSSVAYEDYAYSFTDKSKAEAVATLIGGTVEQVEV